MVQQYRVPRVAAVALCAAVVLALAACSPGDGDGGAAGGVTDAECQRYIEAFELAATVNDPSNAGAIVEVAGTLNDAADQVPAEVGDDFQVMADAYEAYADALDDMNTDFANLGSLSELDAEDLAALESANQALNTPRVQDAAASIDAFLTESCT